MHLGINSDTTKLESSGETAEAGADDDDAVDERKGGRGGRGSHGARERREAWGQEKSTGSSKLSRRRRRGHGKRGGSNDHGHR